MKLKFTVVLHIGQPVKIVVAGPDRVIVAEQHDFHIGKYRGKDTPALAFCNEILLFLSELEV